MSTTMYDVKTSKKVVFVFLEKIKVLF
jgi:hypothetical protein